MRLTVRGEHLCLSHSDAMTQACWLMKSEPNECSIDHLANAPHQTVPWVGVRNYQARNFMRDEMRIGDEVLFYHSSCAEPGIAGLASVASGAYADPTQFDPHSPYYDAKSSPETPRWILVDVKLIRKTRLLRLAELRSHPGLSSMLLLKKGNRLSITRVSPEERGVIQKLLAG
jgi:predicted RNA-binding protein with PUA-like domain